MKQKITKQQVYNLGITPNNFERLGKLAKHDYRGMVNGIRMFDGLTLDTAIDCVIDDIVKDYTIGNMIEFLCDTDFCFPSIGLTESSKIHEMIIVGITCLSGSKKYRGITIESNELCDALWNTIKFILPEIEVDKEDELSEDLSL